MNQLEGQSPSIEQSIAHFGPRRLLQRVRSQIWASTGWSWKERCAASEQLDRLWLELNTEKENESARILPVEMA